MIVGEFENNEKGLGLLVDIWQQIAERKYDPK